MRPIQCENGHYYDPDSYETCPHCAAMDEPGVTVAGPLSGPDETIAGPLTGPNVTGPDDNGKSLEEVINDARGGNADDDDGGETISFTDTDTDTKPVVGWLVCTEGEHYGQDFALRAGRNFVGRSLNMDVALNKDRTVSRDKHAVVVFEPNRNVFRIQEGESRELVYVNGESVCNSQEIKAYDEIILGASRLRLVPFCNSEINWNTLKKPEN